MQKQFAQIAYRAERRQRVAELYIQGWTQTKIAAELNVTQGTISKDLKALQREWRESRIRDFDAARELELQRLDRLEREAWAAWLRSQEPLESTKVLNDASGGKKAQKLTQHRDGDPRFLEQIHKCITSRRALLGLDAPTRIAPTSPDGEEAYHSHVMHELMRLAEQTKNGPDIVDGDYVVAQLQAPENKEGDSNATEEQD